MRDIALIIGYVLSAGKTMSNIHGIRVMMQGLTTSRKPRHAPPQSQIGYMENPTNGLLGVFRSQDLLVPYDSSNEGFSTLRNRER